MVITSIEKEISSLCNKKWYCTSLSREVEVVYGFHYREDKRVKINVKYNNEKGEELFDCIELTEKDFSSNKNLVFKPIAQNKKNDSAIVIEKLSKDGIGSNEIVIIPKKGRFTKMSNLLYDVIDDLRSGKIDIEKAKAISILAQTQINAMKVQLDFERFKKQIQ